MNRSIQSENICLIRDMVQPMWLGIVFVLLLGGCSGPKPVLYPNAHYKEVGEDQVAQDIAECEKEADEHATSSGKGKRVAASTGIGAAIGAVAGAIGGAIIGDPGIGAAVGAASGGASGALGGALRESGPSRAYANYVDRCLVERGYEPMGWD